MALFWSLSTGGSFLVDFLENEIVGFDENLTVALWYDLYTQYTQYSDSVNFQVLTITQMDQH